MITACAHPGHVSPPVVLPPTATYSCTTTGSTSCTATCGAAGVMSTTRICMEYSGGSTTGRPIDQARALWINDAGHCSYYCGLTMPITTGRPIDQARALWINDAGHCSYYCGLTMLITTGRPIDQARAPWINDAGHRSYYCGLTTPGHCSYYLYRHRPGTGICGELCWLFLNNHTLPGTASVYARL